MAQDPKVEGIYGGAVVQAFDKHDGVIAELKKLLEAAESGEVVGLHGAVMYRDGAAGVIGSGLSSYSVIGALSTAHAILLDEQK
jgi:hypothetical protein